MDIEILTKGDKDIGATISSGGFQQLFDAPPVRTYRLTIKSGQELKLERKGPVLLVNLNDTQDLRVNKKSFAKQGDFLFVAPSEKIELANKGQKEYTLAVLELK
jgi:hypothetical protein